MARFKSKLDNVRVAAPCNVDWDTMYGNERVRFCDQCQLSVYNLSEMTKTEAERLVGNAEGRLCVRYYRRRDGSILTQNCPVGLRALRRRMSRISTAIGSTVLSFFAGLGVYGLFGRIDVRHLGRRSFVGVIASQGKMGTVPPAAVRPEPQVIVGDLALVEIPKPKVRRRH
jgi:hypothetical protein